MTDVVLQTLRLTRRFDATPERVFDAWTDPKLVARWLFTSPTSESHTAELDVTVGGRWKITDRRDGMDYTAIGEYRVIDRPRRLVFSFGMPQFSPAMCEIVVELAPDDAGCLMTFSQDDLPSDAVDPTARGWKEMFEGLAAVLAA
jgi:uncharacterized protein YndB with AHSA1/START domain